MEYEIIWTEPAGLQLQEIHEYIAAENPARADRVVENIIARVGSSATLRALAPSIERAANTRSAKSSLGNTGFSTGSLKQTAVLRS